jgi:hypothetical protein
MKPLLFCWAAILPSFTVQETQNPDYKRWASFKVGSWVKMKSEIETDGNKMVLPTESTFTLIEFDEKKAVVEELTVNLVIDKDSPKQEKAKKRTYPAARTKKESAEKEGDEELEIAGKKLSCHWTEVKASPTGAGSVKTWSTPEVPGGVVRLEIVGVIGKSINRFTAVGWEKK